MGNAQLNIPLARALVLGLLLFMGNVHAEDTLEEVVVTGEQPGPGLWQVKNGANTLWILGTHSPLPRDMKWRSREVEALIARSQTVIAPPEIETTGIGFFGALRLVPAALRARAIPDDKTLADVLPADLYARWAVLKQRYDTPKKVEHWRPIIAVTVMIQEALDDAKLTNREIVWPTVEKLAKHHDVEIRRPTVGLEIKDPKGMLSDFANSDMSQEIGCFEGMVTRMEHDLPRLQAQANAWATGDIAGMREITTDALVDRCLAAVTGAPRLAAMIAEARRRFRLETLLVWEGALQRNTNTLAVHSVDELFSADGPLSELRRRGYQVIEPE
jgi:uncharacterized protein YbaP (TraB family)